MEPDHEVETHRVRLASEHQAACLPGLSDDRLRVVRARLLADADKHPDPVTMARLEVVNAELQSRDIR